MKQWLKRLRCRLFGCRLSSIGISGKRDEERRIMVFRNRCVHCGQEYIAEIPFEDLLDHAPIRLEVADGMLTRKKRR